MSNPWTPEQEQAITAGGSNILVAAAAGAGKTATLVERVIRRLADPNDPLDVDKLLVVTFTEAAATEMRDRIGAALQEALNKDPENLRLQRQLALLGRAAISTLHSFCLSLLRQYYYRLGLDPALTVMSEHEAVLLRREVLDDLFAARFDAEGDVEGAFYALVDRYGGGRDDEGLKRLVLELYDYAQSLPHPDQWLDESCARFEVPDGIPIERLDWWEPLHSHIRLELTRAASFLEEAVRQSRLPGGPAAYEATFVQELEMVRAALGAEARWESLGPAVQAVVFDRLPSVRKGTVDEQSQEQAKKMRDEARKLVRTLQETYFSRTPESWLSDLREVAPHLRTLAELVQAFGTAFRMAKAEQGAVDFTDLERFALQLLIDPAAPAGEIRPSDVARELRNRFSEILVDEYQDINGVQDAILELVARDDIPNRFMVGDVKQSIYRFRHANPYLFLHKYQAYQPWGDSGSDPGTGAASGSGPGGHRIVLGANFRSRSGVVDAVNFLFRQILTPSVGELAYDRDAELVCRANYPDRSGDGPDAVLPVEVHLLDRDALKGTEAAGVGAESGGEAEAEVEDSPADAAAELAELSGLEREARLVANRIRAMIEGTDSEPAFTVYDRHAKAYRPVRYRDIVILLRATTGRADIFLDALGRSGIPAYAQLSTGYFAATEVEVVLSLLQVLDNPRQDIPLVAVLRSPIVGLRTGDLARIRVAAPQGSFFEALVAASREEDLSGLAAVLKRFLESVEAWRTAARRNPLSQVLWRIYQETGYLRYVGGMPGGNQRQANLLALYDRARQFDQFARQGLFRFLRFVERLKENETDLGAAPALGEGEDVVRIMSIHKSKGLEFPVVFMADMGKRFGTQDQQGEMLLQKDLGFGPQQVDPQQRVKYPTLAWQAVRERIRMEALAEEMRVLYVALTRARERLILVGSVPGLNETVERHAGVALHAGWALPDALLAAAKSYLDWVIPALVRHDAMSPLRTLSQGTLSPERVVGADSSCWKLFLWDAAAQQNLVQTTQEENGPAVDWERIFALEPLEEPAGTGETAATLARRFAWQYPHEPLVARFAKLTVTELKGHFNPETAEPAVPPADLTVKHQRLGGRLSQRPRFLQETRKSLTPTEFGTLMHLVLQHIRLTESLDVANVEEQLQAMVDQQILSAQQVEAVNTRMIADFFATPLGELMRQQPERVRREVSFTLGMDVSEVYPEMEYEPRDREIVVVQGMIDVLVEHEDGFVLVDYKTDKRDPLEAAKAYYGQVSIYRRAVESILGKPVKEAYLHFLMENQSVLM